MDPSVAFDPKWYQSIGGIIAATLIIVQILKRLIGGISFFGRWPTWCYSVLVALVLTFAASYAGVLTLADNETLFDKISMAVVGAAMASGFWSWFSQPADRLEYSTLARKSKESGTGSGLRAIVVCLLTGSMALGSACATGAEQSARHTAVQVDTTVATSLFALQDVEKAVYGAGLVAQPWHQEFNKRLVPLLESGLKFNRLIRAWDPAQPMPKEIRELIPQFKTLLDHVVGTLTNGEAKAKLLDKIAIAQAAILAALNFLPQVPDVTEIINQLRHDVAALQGA